MIRIPRSMMIGLFIVVLFQFMCPSLTHAAIFNVDSASELQSALSSAASNGQDDEVHISQGSYVGTFIYATTTEMHHLLIRGGYSPDFSSYEKNPVNTILDANNNGPVLAFSAQGLSSNLVVEGITFQNGRNTANDGGGLIIFSSGNIEIDTCIVTGCTTGSYYSGGGFAINIYDYGNINIHDCTITGNESRYDGAGYVYAYLGSVNVSNTIVTNNVSGIYCAGLHIGSSEQVTVTNNHIINNRNVGYGGMGYSGGLFIWGTHVVISNNIIADNYTYGGTFSLGGGGIYLAAADECTIVNNTIVNNTSANSGGGGIFAIINRVTDVLNIYNNIIYNNTAPQGADIYINNDGDGNYIPDGVIGIYNNDFNQETVGTYIRFPLPIDTSNLNNLAPLFMDGSNGDFHLQQGSPLIDKGLNGALDLPSYDLDGNSRILDGDANGVGTVDIGAYEFLPVSICECDLNNNGRCDMRDWLLFGQRWGATNCNTVPCACDLNADGRCDMRDWLIFGQDWGRTDCPVQ